MSEEKTEGTENQEEALEDKITITNSVEGGTKTAPTLSFSVEWIDANGERKSGDFEAARPNIGAVQRIAVLKARYNGGERVTIDVDFINEMMAYCDVVLTSTPKWWSPSTFFTASPLRKVWDHLRSWEQTFRRKHVEQRSGAAPGVGSGEAQV